MRLEAKSNKICKATSTVICAVTYMSVIPHLLLSSPVVAVLLVLLQAPNLAVSPPLLHAPRKLLKHQVVVVAQIALCLESQGALRVLGEDHDAPLR